MVIYDNMENRKIPNELEDLTGDLPNRNYKALTNFF